MENGENHDPLGLSNIEDRIRETAYPDTPNLLVLDWIAIRILGRKIDCLVNLHYELSP